MAVLPLQFRTMSLLRVPWQESIGQESKLVSPLAYPRYCALNWPGALGAHSMPALCRPSC